MNDFPSDLPPSDPADYASLPPLPKRCSIVVLAVGGGACAMLPAVLKDWKNPPTVAAVNTDVTSLRDSGVPLSLAIGQSSACGLGTAGDPSAGALAAEEDLDSLRTLLSGHDLLLLVASLGGGTGSGAAPVIARLAREQGLLTLAYVTTPFAFEDPRRAAVADDAIRKLRQTADAVVRLPNEALGELLPKETPLVDAFKLVDRMLAAALRGLWTLLSRDNILNLDFADVQALVEHSNNECRFGYAEAEGPDRAARVVEALLSSPLLEHGRVIANSGAMLVNIVGDKALTLEELNTIRSGLESVAISGARIRIGAAVPDGWTGPLSITVLAAEHAPARLAPSPVSPSASPARRTRKSAPAQAELPFAASPSLTSSSPAQKLDLDTPTYVRRGIQIPS
jgi:cell division protein FtsZ